MLPASEALQRLIDGNARFVAGEHLQDGAMDVKLRAELSKGQAPFAVILGCSDSRVPAEIVFDQRLGDLFVIRVAGNVVASSQIGSVEFAAEHLGVRLVVVMGHTGCGAVAAALRSLLADEEDVSSNLQSILDRILPAIVELKGSPLRQEPEVIAREAVLLNIRHSRKRLIHGSSRLESLIAHGGLQVVCAEYDLERGKVHFFE